MPVSKPKDGKIKYAGWLVLRKNGTWDMKKTQPKLLAGEHTAQIEVTVPAALFEKPTLKVEVSFDGSNMTKFGALATSQVQNLLDGAGLSAMVVDVSPIKE